MKEINEYRKKAENIVDGLVSRVRIVDKDKTMELVNSCLLVKSVRDSRLEMILEDLIEIRKDLLFTIIGDADNNIGSICDRYSHNISGMISSEGRFCINQVSRIIDQLENEELDCIIYFNYGLHREERINVEEYVATLGKALGIKAFVYLVDDKIMAEYTNLENHAKLLKEYIETLNALEHLSMEKKI